MLCKAKSLSVVVNLIASMNKYNDGGEEKEKKKKKKMSKSIYIIHSIKFLISLEKYFTSPFLPPPLSFANIRTELVAELTEKKKKENTKKHS